jgi:hypothetical protein
LATRIQSFINAHRGFDFGKCQTVAASPAEPGELPFWFRLPTGQTRPVTNWFWCVAESGERNSTVSHIAFGPQQQHEKELQALRQVELEKHRVAHEMWEAQRQASSQHPEPEEPLNTLILASDFTYEGLVHCLHRGQPLFGIVGAEGGQFLGDSQFNGSEELTIAGLNSLWRDDPIQWVGTKGALTLCGRRVGMYLKVQPERAATAFAAAAQARQGFLARILTCASESLIGKRRLPQEPPPEAREVLQRYQDRMLGILRTPYPLAPGTRNELAPRAVPFSVDAAMRFSQFADEAAEQSAPGGDYESIPLFAERLPEHASRLGAAIAAYQDLNFAELSGEGFQRGVQLATFYASEAKRLVGASGRGRLQQPPPPRPEGGSFWHGEGR